MSAPNPITLELLFVPCLIILGRGSKNVGPSESLIKSATITLQVSTATGVISHFVNLQVVVPEAFILGSGELHVDMGSTINLVCIIEKVRLITRAHCADPLLPHPSAGPRPISHT